jgi:hypothetical protein
MNDQVPSNTRVSERDLDELIRGYAVMAKAGDAISSKRSGAVFADEVLQALSELRERRSAHESPQSSSERASEILGYLNKCADSEYRYFEISPETSRELRAYIRSLQHTNAELRSQVLAVGIRIGGFPEIPDPRAAHEPRPVEVWNGERKVTIYDDSVLRSWGPNINTEMTDESRTLESVQAAMDWLYSTQPPCAHLKAVKGTSLTDSEYWMCDCGGVWTSDPRTAQPPAPEPHVIKQIEHAIEDCPGSVTRQFADYIRGCISDYRHALTKGEAP